MSREESAEHSGAGSLLVFACLFCVKVTFLTGKIRVSHRRSRPHDVRSLSAQLAYAPSQKVRQAQDDALFGILSKANVLFYGTSRAPSPTEIGANTVFLANLTLWSSWGGGTQELAGANETRSE